MKNNSLKWLLPTLIVCVGCMAGQAWSQDDPPAPATPPAGAPGSTQKTDQQAEDEKQMAKEEAADRAGAGGDSILHDYVGNLTLFSKEEIDASGDPLSIGKFDCADGSHLVRVMVDKVKDLLKPYDHKDVTLHGKLRLNGKYIYVERTVANGPANGYIGRHRGGMGG